MVRMFVYLITGFLVRKYFGACSYDGLPSHNSSQPGDDATSLSARAIKDWLEVLCLYSVFKDHTCVLCYYYYFF